MYIMFMRVGKKPYDIERQAVFGRGGSGSPMGIRRDDPDELYRIAAAESAKILADNPRAMVVVRVAKYI